MAVAKNYVELWMAYNWPFLSNPGEASGEGQRTPRPSGHPFHGHRVADFTAILLPSGKQPCKHDVTMHRRFHTQFWRQNGLELSANFNLVEVILYGEPSTV